MANRIQKAFLVVQGLLTGLSVLYVGRIPIASALLLLLLPAICLFLAPTLLHNLLVASAWHLFWTAAAAYILAWSIQVTYRIAAINRFERLGLPSQASGKPPSTVAKVLLRLLPVPLLASIFVLRSQADRPANWFAYLLAGAAGYFLAYMLSFGSVLIAQFFAPQGHVQANHFFPLFFSWQNRVLRWADSKQPFNIGFFVRLQPSLAAQFPNGYFDKTGKLYGGHWIALSSATLSILLYVGLGFARSPNVPALAYVLQVLFLLTWVFAGVAFFLDRLRIPLLVPLALLCFGNTLPSFLPAAWTSALPLWLPSSDHYYEIFQSADQADPPKPSQVLNGFIDKTANKVIVVATAGGGIQAAAWTAEVLTRLQSSIAPEAGKQSFAKSIAMMSGVSGGTVGMMFFGSAYGATPNAQFPSDSNTLKSIVDAAETPTLDEVAWGLTNPDLARIAFPFLKFGNWKLDDRGRALENAWERAMTKNVKLSAWTNDTRNGYRPAFIFNSTIAETGEPLLFATSSLSYGQVTKGGRKLAQRKTFYSEFSKNDVKVVTAARIASSFPFVTPAARPLRQGIGFHQVDGGYYDNYGLSSLMAWLAEALDHRDSKAAKPEILILQIRSFPQDETPSATWKTWFYQTYAPVDALQSVRTTGQLIRDKEELKYFESAQRDKAVFCNVTFGYLGLDAPLSWQLNRRQKEEISDGWDKQTPGLEKVRGFLQSGASAPSCKDDL